MTSSSSLRTVLRRALPIALVASAALHATACAEDPAPLFEPEGSGQIEGRLFYDADNNAFFSPLGGDTSLSGVLVVLAQRHSDEVIDSVRTGAEGMFSFADVPPGTHDLFIVRDTLTTPNLIFCQNPVRPSVYIGELAFLSVPAKGGCVISIRAAKDTAQGRPATIAGVVTAGQGTYRGDNAYIQDPTGGIQVFGLPSALALQPGDSIEVSGTLGQFGGEIQLLTPTVAPNIARGREVPEPLQTTTGAIATSVGQVGAKSPFVGLLLKVSAPQIGEFFPGTPPRNAPIDDGTGAIEIRLDGNVVNSLPHTAFTPGNCYDITGILGYFNGIIQLKPRGPADVTEVPCS